MAPALTVAGGPALSLESWQRRSDAVAHGLAGRGLRPGAVVLLMFDNARWTDYAVAYLGVQKAGGVAVPLTPRLSRLELSRVLADAGATAVVVAPGLDRPAAPGWVAELAELEDDDGEVTPVGWDPSGPSEILYDSGPLRRPARIPSRASQLPLPARLLHAFPLGSPAGQDALLLPLRHRGSTATVVPGCHPDLLWASAREASTIGLTPATARMLIDFGGPVEAPAVADVVVVGEATLEGLRSGLAELFPMAFVRFVQPGGLASRPPADASAPMTATEQMLVWQEQFRPGCYNLPPFVRRLSGALDVGALRAALSEIARRHEILRATFQVVGDEPVRIVSPPSPVALPVVDLAGLEPEERDAELARLVTDATNRPVDLTRDSLFEPSLVRLAHDVHLLVVPMHHCVWDAWSVGVLHREISVLYRDLVTGTALSLPEPALQMSDVSRRQHELLTGDEGGRQLSYWQRELAGAPVTTQLPLEDPELPPGALHPPAQPVSLVLPPLLTKQVRELARAHRSTTFMVLLAAFGVLGRHAVGRDDLLISSVVANRNRTELEGVIGCVAKRVLVRLRGSEGSFVDALRAAREALLGALSNQDVPDETLLRDVLGPPALRHGLVPHVAVMFQGLTVPRARIELPGLSASNFDPTTITQKRVHFSAAEGPAWGCGLYRNTFLALFVSEAEDGITCLVRGVFHPPAVRRLLDRYQALLEAVVAEPDRSLHELGSAVQGWGDAVAPPPGSVDIRGFRVDPSRVEAVAALCPGVREVAVVARHDDPHDPRLVAYVVASGEHAPTLARLRRCVWTELPGYAWPADLVVVPSLPRRPDGQVDTAVLPAPAPAPVPAPAGDEESRAGPARPSTYEAGLLAALWAEAAGVERVQVTEDYRQSFAFLEGASRAYQEGLPVTGQQVMSNRTIETLATAMAAESARRSEDADRP